MCQKLDQEYSGGYGTFRLCYAVKPRALCAGFALLVFVGIFMKNTEGWN